MTRWAVVALAPLRRVSLRDQINAVDLTPHFVAAGQAVERVMPIQLVAAQEGEPGRRGRLIPRPGTTAAASGLCRAQGKDLLRRLRAAGLAFQRQMQPIPHPASNAKAFRIRHQVPVFRHRAGIGQPVLRVTMLRRARQIQWACCVRRLHHRRAGSVRCHEMRFRIKGSGSGRQKTPARRGRCGSCGKA